jgi:uncharacterized repeat protein (TIGR03843 family)
MSRSSTQPQESTTPTESAETPIAVTVDQLVSALETGTVDPKGLLPYSSNYNFLVTVDDGLLQVPAVYKPRRGESPLWDFAQGTLCLRERAAFVVSEALDWELVPPTVLRDGPHGLGSVQFFVDADPDDHYFTVREDARHGETLRRFALFDVVINNADRKSGHCLLDGRHRLWAIDHGICFHEEHKLRTVIWEFADEAIPGELLADLLSFQSALRTADDPVGQELATLLSVDEMQAMKDRLDMLIQAGRFPSPLPHRRNFPWPPI